MFHLPQRRRAIFELGTLCRLREAHEHLGVLSLPEDLLHVDIQIVQLTHDGLDNELEIFHLPVALLNHLPDRGGILYARTRSPSPSEQLQPAPPY